MFYVYILQSQKDLMFYIGFTTDLKRRFQEHSSGNNASTQQRRPYTLMGYEYHKNKEDALRRESYFKTAKGKSTLRQMLRCSLLEQKIGGDISVGS